MNTILKRVISMVLCFVLVAGYLPVGAFAEETGETVAPVVTEETAAQTSAVTEATSATTEATDPIAEPSKEATVLSSVADALSDEASEPAVIAVTGITLDQAALEVEVGAQPVTLTATVLPEDATDKTVTWSSSNEAVATVEEGVVTFHQMGEAVITASAGEFSASCTVKVVEGKAVVYANDNIDYLFIATDRHANTTVIGNVINNMETAIGENELDYLALGGDMVGSGNTHPAYNSSTVLGEVTGATSSLSAANVDIVAGIHDMNVTDDAGIVLPYQGGGAQIYEGTKFYVYGVEEYCISDDSNESNWSSEAQKFVTWANGSDIDKSKAIIVVSHYPLHVNRNDNDGAYYWHKALNTVATGRAEGTSAIRNVVFFHGHNHTVDSNEYVYNVGDTMSVQNGSSTTSDTIYYTYATAGYLNQNKKATLVTIDADSIALTKYGTSGSGTAMATVERVSGEVTPTEQTVTGTDGSTVVTATGLGLTDIDITWNETAITEEFDKDETVAYDVVLTGYTGGDVALTFSIVDMTAEDLVVYVNGEPTTDFSAVMVAEEDLNTLEVSLKQSSANATYIIGKKAVSADATLTGIAVTSQPTTTNYTLLDAIDGKLYLDIAGLVVTATYDDGKTAEIDWNQFDETKDGYALSFDLSTAGTKTVTVTYGGCTTSFEVTVYESNAVDADVDEYVSGVLAAGYIAKDITPTDYVTGTSIRVVMPAPAGANVVYHVAEDGTLTRIENPVFENGYVTFTTDHFSIYVVGTSTEITVPDPETATGSGSTTTTEEKEVYVLVDTPTAGNQYIIVNTNTAGSGYALKENTTTGSSITVNAAGNGISAPYIETTDETIMWNTASGMTFQSENGGYYLRYNDGLTFSTSNSTNWTYSDSNTLYYPYSSYRNYYLYNSNGTWTASRYTSDEVYLYEWDTVKVETTTNASGTYSIAGNPDEVTKIVTNGATATLGSTLTFTPDSGSATTTENPTGVTYTVVEGGDPNGVISGISGNTVTFTGVYGKALVKVSYETSFGTVTNYITVNASEPTYTLDITSGGTVVTGTTITQKGVTASTTLQLGTQIQFVDEDGAEIVDLPEGATIEWHIPEEYHGVATVGHDTGLVSFKGVNGAFYVTATLTVNGKDYTVGVNISATIDNYTVPSDGVSDFPEYPNEGAIRYDKTATAVGNFSETGIAQVELSMTGVPYTTGSEIDVVLMLDMTGSMDDVTSSTSKPTGYVRVDATIAASKAFIGTIVKNEDGSYNGNRVGVYVFNKNGAATLFDFGTVDSDTELEAIEADLDSIYADHYASGGTPYDDGLAKCQSVLSAAKTDGIGNDRQQFCVFMTDGVPTSYAYVNGTSYGTHSSASAIAGMLTSASNYATRDTDYKYEYYSTEMKKDGVTVYSVGIGLENTNNAWSGSATQCLNLASALLNDISGPANEAQQPDGIGSSTHSKQDHYFFSVEDATAATDMEKVFTNIAMKILQAATDVTVEDQVGDNYTMIFDIPEGSKEITGVSNDFYIEFGKYALDENHERTTFTSLTKVYLTNTNDVLSAKDGTDPVFEQKTIGEKGTLYYWSTNAADGDSDVSVTVDGTTYYFVSYGMEEAGYNMTSGTYANGKVDSATNMSNDLVIATPYFVYNAYTKMLYWTVDKLDTEEYALRYFVYLNNSATEVGTANETDPGSYLTNDHAYITYTNFQGTDCRQEFPKPQLTWNGAQVSYVFYLVNAAGQPINKSGQVVDFANASFVTDVYTDSVVWNKEGDTTTGTGQLSANWLADDLLPDEYEIYDEQARYVLNVYENANGTTIKNEFTISGNTAANISSSLNTRLDLNTTASTVSVNTTKVYNTKAGEKISAYGTYTNADDSMKNFDFANTTVAFAVVWQPRLVPDTVVVDYGLDVLINVVQNDILQNSLTGIGVGNTAYGNIAMNTGVSTTSKLGTADLTIDGNTISIANENSVRFHQGDMEFAEPVEFYYETPVEFWEGSDPTEGFMYSSVTVIPATTVYYEDDFLTLTSFTKSGDTWAEDNTSKWTASAQNGVQDQDRPGASQISAAIDADNNYGYDSAYETMSTHSLGSAAKITVGETTRGEATFTFYGTGFDVISTTSNTTGTITVKVTDADGNVVKNSIVDTYYGYTRDDAGNWVTTTGDNALYQVPVMKYFGMAYGQYTVKITAGYNEFFDHVENSESYDLYLDAIRIYDPTGNQDDVANDAYVDDGEGWPTYFEVRNQIISKNTFDNLNDETVSGIVFIDGAIAAPSIEDYTSYGPNNETYLDNGQAIAFDLNGTYTVPSGKKLAKIQMAIKTVGGTGKVEVYGVKDGVTTACLNETISTATDMYYDITALDGKTVVIKSTGDAIISITNVKVTYAPVENAVAVASVVEETIDAPALFTVSRASANAALATMNVEEEVPETTAPDASEPEPSEPEETVPEEPVSTRLQSAVDAAKQLQEKDYTQKSFKALKTALKSAEKVLKDKKATEAKLEAALEALNAAVAALEARPDTAALQSAVDAAKKLKEKDYTAVSYKAVTTARKAAEKLLKDKNATQAKVDAALEALNAAVAALEAKADTTALKAAVNAAKKLKEKDYTVVSYKAVTAARKAAEKVMKDKNANQAAADAALEALNAAVAALEARANTAALKSAVNAAKKLKSKNYTADSFQVLTTARKAAEKLMKDKNANQAMADEALAVLNEAMAALVAKPGKN